MAYSALPQGHGQSVLSRQPQLPSYASTDPHLSIEGAPYQTNDPIRTPTDGLVHYDFTAKSGMRHMMPDTADNSYQAFRASSYGRYVGDGGFDQPAKSFVGNHVPTMFSPYPRLLDERNSWWFISWTIDIILTILPIFFIC
jgi:hypothetical protein